MKHCRHARGVFEGELWMLVPPLLKLWWCKSGKHYVKSRMNREKFVKKSGKSNFEHPLKQYTWYACVCLPVSSRYKHVWSQPKVENSVSRYSLVLLFYRFSRFIKCITISHHFKGQEWFMRMFRENTWKKRDIWEFWENLGTINCRKFFLL